MICPSCGKIWSRSIFPQVSKISSISSHTSQIARRLHLPVVEKKSALEIRRSLCVILHVIKAILRYSALSPRVLSPKTRVSCNKNPLHSGVRTGFHYFDEHVCGVLSVGGVHHMIARPVHNRFRPVSTKSASTVYNSIVGDLAAVCVACGGIPFFFLFFPDFPFFFSSDALGLL